MNRDVSVRVVVASDRTDAARLVARLRDDGAEVLLAVAADAPASAAADAATGREAAELLGALAAADVLAVDAGRHALTPRLVAVCDRFGVRIVAVCDGAAESRLAEMFGVATCRPEAAVEAILSAAEVAPPVPAQRGRVIAVWGPHGAPGRTTLAIELASELARDGRRVGLADADTHAPSIAMLTGLPDEGPGFAAACRAAERGSLTAAELERIALPLGDVAVLTGINRPGRWPELTSARVDAALQQCRAWVDDIVVDLAAPLERDEEIVSDLDGLRRNAASLAVLAAADIVVAVVSADPVGISRFVRAHPELRAAAGAARILVVVNKMRASTLGLDARAQVRRTLERYAGVSESWFVPWDPKAADAAVLQGQPVGRVAARSALCGALRRFVGEAIAPPPAAARAGGTRARRETHAGASSEAPDARARTRRGLRGAA